MKHTLHYNEMVRFYDRSRKKLQSLIARGKNFRKQDILKKRIARLVNLLTGMQGNLKKATATAALAAGMVIFQPVQTKAVSFGPPQSNPFGLTSGQYNVQYPLLVDIDNDGDLDLFSSKSGTTDGDRFFSLPIVYRQNNGTTTQASFGSFVQNPFGITLPSHGAYWLSLSAADLDLDGDLDLLAGAAQGDFFYYQNTGTASSPVFSGSGIPLGSEANAEFNIRPSLADMDADGDYDLIYASTDFSSYSYTSNVYYIPNTGTVSSPNFSSPRTLVFNPLPFTFGEASSALSFTDLDKDGDLDMMYGSNPSQMVYFLNTGSSTNFQFSTSPLINPFGLSSLQNTGAANMFAFGDLDHDGDKDMLEGASNGSSFYFHENTTPIPPSSIPTLSEWGLISLAALMLGVGVFSIRNRIG